MLKTKRVHTFVPVFLNGQIVEMRGVGRTTMKSLVRAIAVSRRIGLSGSRIVLLSSLVASVCI